MRGTEAVAEESNSSANRASSTISSVTLPFLGVGTTAASSSWARRRQTKRRPFRRKSSVERKAGGTFTDPRLSPNRGSLRGAGLYHGGLPRHGRRLKPQFFIARPEKPEHYHVSIKRLHAQVEAQGQSTTPTEKNQRTTDQ